MKPFQSRGKLQVCRRCWRKLALASGHSFPSPLPALSLQQLRIRRRAASTAWRQERMEDRGKAPGAWWRQVVVKRIALVKNTAREKKNWGPEAVIPYLGI